MMGCLSEERRLESEKTHTPKHLRVTYVPTSMAVLPDFIFAGGMETSLASK